MFGLLRNLTGREETPDAPPRLPPELVAAIERMEVIHRQNNEDGAMRVAVRLPGLGSAWLEDNELANRIRSAYPELSPVCLRRAIELVEAELAERNRRAFRGKPDRPSWVWGWAQ